MNYRVMVRCAGSLGAFGSFGRAFVVALAAALATWVAAGDAPGPSVDASPRRSDDGLWRFATAPSTPGEKAGLVSVDLDVDALATLLSVTTSADGEIPRVDMTLPLPDGSFARFHLESAPPQGGSVAVRSFRGRNLTGALSVRIEWTGDGLWAVVTGLTDAVYVDPDPMEGASRHVVYFAREADRPLVVGGDLPLKAVRDIEAAMARKDARTPAQKKIASRLLDATRAGGDADLDIDDAGRLLLDIEAEVAPPILARIEALGGTVVDSVERYRAIRAWLPRDALESLAAESDVTRIRPAERGITNHELANAKPKEALESKTPLIGTRIVRAHGAMVPLERSPHSPTVVDAQQVARPRAGMTASAENTSEGDLAHAAATARERYGVDGRGIGIGVLSNGIETLADRQATGDLPPSVTVLAGQAGDRGDEGTAMLEIVHDLAPGAHLFFATAFGGTARFAANIEALCAAGADIIVDDVFYFDEGAFQDDTVARAINAAAADGCFHFSAAGNSGNADAGTSGVWEGDFAAAEGEPPPGVDGVVLDFGGVDSNAIEEGGLALQLKWADPLGASTNDYDLYLFDETLTVLLADSTDVQDGYQDPYERITSATFPVGSRLVVVKASGEDRYLRLNTARGRLEHATHGQIYGHAGAKSAVTSGAVDARTAGGEAGQFDGSEEVEDFSSDGPRRMFYQPDGTPITPGDFSATGGEVVDKPDIAAADGVTTATPGFRDFHGTSAAAPHAAAIAALAVQAAGGPRRVTMDELRMALVAGALDIGPEGADRNAGAGIVVAPAAVATLNSTDEHHAPVVATPIGDRTLSGLDGATIDLSAHFVDEDGDDLAYGAPTGDAGVATARVEASTLTLTPFRRGSTTVTVRATDPGGLSVFETFVLTVDREWGETDYDTDDDGLIEIAALEQLDAIRHDLDGDGIEDVLTEQPLYFAAFPDAARDLGCPTGCTGYELTRDLDFDDPAGYASGEVAQGWSRADGGPGWVPLGSFPSGLDRPLDRFAGDFHGNGHAIVNLFIDRGDRDDVGLFGSFSRLASEGPRRITDLRLVDVDVTGRDHVGGLVGSHGSCPSNGCLVRGVSVTGRVRGNAVVGGLAGRTDARVAYSFAAAQTSAQRDVGGLVGSGGHFADITGSYATGTVSGGDNAGGLAGDYSGSIVACYATGPVAGEHNVGGLVGSANGDIGVWSSYSTGGVAGERNAGGVIGGARFAAPFYATYWNVQTSGTRIGVGSDDADGNGRVDGDERQSEGVLGKTTAELTAPRGYRGIYANWRVAAIGDEGFYPGGFSSPRGDGRSTEEYDQWDFGTGDQYPALKADFGRTDGLRTWQEFGRQLRVQPGLALTAGSGVVALAWREPAAHWPAPHGIRFNVYRNGELLAADIGESVYEDRPPAQEAPPGQGMATRYEYQVAAVVDGGEPVRSLAVAVANRSPAPPPVANGAARVGESFRYVFPPSTDPDGDGVVHRVGGIPPWLTVDPPTRTFSGTPGEGAATVDIRVTATDSGTPPLSATAAFRLAVNPSSEDNQAPEVDGTIAALELATGERETVDVAAVFSDPDGDALSFGARVDDAAVATAHPSGDGLLVEATGAGRTTVTAIASDGDSTAELAIEVEVANAAPQPTAPVPDRDIVLPGSPWRVDASEHFADADGDAPSYDAESSDTAVVVVNVDDAAVTATPVGGGTATVTVLATDVDGSGATARQTARIAVGVDYDHDGDGLIEVTNLGQLDALRFDPDGDGVVGSEGVPRFPTTAMAAAYDTAFPHRRQGTGCPAGCTGYELMADLDFDTNGNGAADAGDRFWNDGLGWAPIVGAASFGSGVVYVSFTNDDFRAVFDGNGHTLSHLFIDRSASAAGRDGSFRVGLFARIGREGAVRNLRLESATVVGDFQVGALAGANVGRLDDVVATGTVKGREGVGGVSGAVLGDQGVVGWAAGTARNVHADVRVTGEWEVGGLVGRIEGSVDVASSTGAVVGAIAVGGLAGINFGTVAASFASGTTEGEKRVGGLVGANFGVVSRSYATGATRGRTSVGGLVGLHQGASRSSIAAGYATGDVAGDEWVGGLVGGHGSGRIVASYATGAVVGERDVGGLIGWARDPSETAAAYSERHAAAGFAIGTPASKAGSRTTADLLAPPGYEGIYGSWNIDLDGDGEADDPWTFEVGRYPVLKADGDGDGATTSQEFGLQHGPTGVEVRLADEVTGGLVVSWHAPADPAPVDLTRYEVQRKVGDEPFAGVDPPHYATTTSYADTAPAEGTAHTYRVRAVTPRGATHWSAPGSTAPGPPSLAFESGPESATLIFTPPNDAGTSPVVGYQYQQTIDDGATWDPAWTDVPAGETFTISELSSGVSYGFELRAVNGSGPGAGSARAVVVLGTPGPPRNLSATVGHGRVTLAWSPPADTPGSAITGYQFRQSSDGGATWVPDWSDVPGGVVSAMVLQGLANAASFVFEVRAVNAVGPGAAARVAVSTPPALARPFAKLELQALGDAETLELGRFFAVAPGGHLSFAVDSSDPALVRVRIDADRLVVTPNDVGEDGTAVITVTATDDEGRSVSVKFVVTVDPLRGFWHRWGFRVIGEAKQSWNED